MPDKYLEQVKALLLLQIPDAEVWAYGSRVNGNYHETSDLNLVARFSSSGKQDASTLSELREAFTESNLPIFVRIVDWDGIPDSFRDEITAGYIVVQANLS
ncbi:MAG: nucleotidyltransferase domain-containing protein [Gammaproteobacteria bacterium]|nr:nucleotidyltransferase domain-containing protein [Gammaproteobacteria bacterium]